MADRDPRQGADIAAHELRQRLSEANRRSLLGELASGLAHDLNQPLAAITTFAQAGSRLLAEDRVDLVRAREVLAEIAKQSLRAGDVMRRIQQIIRHQDFSKVDVDCRALAEDFMTLAGPIARINQVQLTMEMPDSLPPIVADPVQLLQLLMILFQNAVEAVQEIPVDSRAVAVVVAGNRHHIELAVLDNGTGISDATAGMLFRPFFTTKSRGSGLGLAICRSIASRHGGEVRFETRSTGGARFSVVLPVVTDGR